MGMQCSFNYTDLTDNVPTHTERDAESNTYTVTVTRQDIITLQYWQFNLAIPDDKQADKHFCWFDVGASTPEQMEMLAFLIRNRIPFTCA